ncbi:SDR family NAD(P)-dependent oxidoreductase [Delftia sp. UME58]|uniref:SDR family NAD(P)-dependent oxidoreductase n=1 Tax=Delftia sp. UME58 TaxID=1862322 RepID=UPI0015FF8363|nr:SDR family NAD(P)-dependent oxidoreductase [Delftia sp. UME58]
MADMDGNPATGAPKGTELLLIGGSGGIGSALAQRLAREGFRSIVLASRQPAPVDAAMAAIAHETVDVSDLASVQSLAARLQGRDLRAVINCAGVNGNQSLFTDGDTGTARREMEVNYFGMMHVGLVFGPLLAARGGGTLMTVLSLLSHASLPQMATYCASKAAAHSLNQSLRAQLRTQGVRVCGVYPSAIDTRMSRDLQVQKMSPGELADAMADFLQGGDEDLFPGEAAKAHEAWRQDPVGFQQAMAAAP